MILDLLGKTVKLQGVCYCPGDLSTASSVADVTGSFRRKRCAGQGLTAGPALPHPRAPPVLGSTS